MKVKIETDRRNVNISLTFASDKAPLIQSIPKEHIESLVQILQTAAKADKLKFELEMA